MLTVFALFRSTYELEKAVLNLLSQQIQGSQIQVVPMRRTKKAPKPKGLVGWLMRGGALGDTRDRSDGTSVMDGVAAGATLGGLGGILAGAAVLPGPVVLAVVGILGGGLVGYLLDICIPEKRPQEYAAAIEKGAVLVQVQCRSDAEADAAERILRENQAQEMGRAPV